MRSPRWTVMVWWFWCSFTVTVRCCSAAEAGAATDSTAATTPVTATNFIDSPGDGRRNGGGTRQAPIRSWYKSKDAGRRHFVQPRSGARLAAHPHAFVDGERDGADGRR